MSNTAEHKVAMHRLASERMAAGKPSWQHRIDLSGVFHNDALTFEQSRNAIVDCIRRTSWFKGLDATSDAYMAVEELADTDEQGWFNDVWDALYDHFDYERVWVITR